MLLLSSLCGFFLICGLPSLGIFSLLRLVGPLATGSSSYIPLLFSLAESSVSLSLPLVFLLANFGWSSGHFVAFCDLFGLCSLVGSAREVLFSSVSGFSSSCLGVPGSFPSCFLFEPRCFPFLPSWGPLVILGYPVCPLLLSFLASFCGFVCLLSAVLLSPVPVSRLSCYSCPCLSSSSISLSVSSPAFLFSF